MRVHDDDVRRTLAVQRYLEWRVKWPVTGVKALHSGAHSVGLSEFHWAPLNFDSEKTLKFIPARSAEKNKQTFICTVFRVR